MATITLKGNPILTSGDLPKIGEKAPKTSEEPNYKAALDALINE